MENIEEKSIITVGTDQTIQSTNTFLTENNIFILKRMFPDEATYIEHMKTLWVLREAAGKCITIQTPQGETYDTSHPYFKILKLTNEFIGALLQSGISFRIENGKVYHFKKG